MDNIWQELLKYFLPTEIDWKRYKLIKVDEIEDNNISPFVWRLEFHIEELNIVPDSIESEWKSESKWKSKSEWKSESEWKWKKIISKWFYPSIKVHDFPVRDKIATLRIKRRKWQEKWWSWIINKQIECIYPHTQTTKDLLSFLK